MVIIMQKIGYKRGWIEIVEAFVSILLIVGAILIILNQPYLSKSDISERIYNIEISILREIQTNDHFREEIANAPEPLPIEWKDPRFPQGIKEKIIERTPDYLTCVAQICNLNETCSLRKTEEIEEQTKNRDIYAQSVSITATLPAPYEPTSPYESYTSGNIANVVTLIPLADEEGPTYRKLNLFCWLR